jgi:hypothetical protein
MRGKFSIGRVVIILVIVLALGVGIAYYTGALQVFGVYRPANAIVIIAPYKYGGVWVFDDPAVGLRREPFVAGVPEMLDAMTADIPDAEQGFRLYFSATPFPGYTHKFTWLRGDQSGNWYYCEQLDMEGWLCPGLLAYYKDAPKELYAKAEAK